MTSTIYQGKEVKEIDLVDLFPPSEGQISQYYGRIGQGKTYAGTSDVLELLRKGEVVYVNWPINYNGFDERKDISYVIMSLILPWKKRFFNFPKENLKFLPIDEHFHEKLQSITDAHVFLDEGHVVFDSYEMAKLDIKKRMSILHTRHFNRSIHIISQRPTAIHVVMRANVNVFYKCEKILHWGSLIIFRRTEFQDMTGETVDEGQPLGAKYYFGKRSVMNAYDSQYLRGDMKSSQKLFVNAFDFDYRQRMAMLSRYIVHNPVSSFLLKLYNRYVRKAVKIKVKHHGTIRHSVSIQKSDRLPNILARSKTS